MLKTIDEILFELKESTISDSGQGLFAKVPFKKGMMLCEYNSWFYEPNETVLPVHEHLLDKSLNWDGISDMMDKNAPSAGKGRILGNSFGLKANDNVVLKKYNKTELREIIKKNSFPQLK